MTRRDARLRMVDPTRRVTTAAGDARSSTDHLEVDAPWPNEIAHAAFLRIRLTRVALGGLRTVVADGEVVDVLQRILAGRDLARRPVDAHVALAIAHQNR